MDGRICVHLSIRPWVDAWVDAWMDECMDERREGGILWEGKGREGGRKGWTDEKTDRWTDWRTDTWTDVGRTEEGTEGRLVDWWMDGKRDGWVEGLRNGSVNRCLVRPLIVGVFALHKTAHHYPSSLQGCQGAAERVTEAIFILYHLHQSSLSTPLQQSSFSTTLEQSLYLSICRNLYSLPLCSNLYPHSSSQFSPLPICSNRLLLYPSTEIFILYSSAPLLLLHWFLKRRIQILNCGEVK